MNANRRWLWAAAAAAMLLVAGLATGATKKTRQGDTFWQRPDLAEIPLRSIAMLPPITLDHNVEVEKLTGDLQGAALRATRYRWIGPSNARTLLMRAPDGDSLIKAVQARLIERAPLDSMGAREICRRLRVSAVLGLRIDRWEKLEMEFNQAGKPSTSVGMTASLVDSTGRALWSATGTEFAEGPYHDPTAAVVGVKASGLNNMPMTNQAGAPPFQEVATALLMRWSSHFPAPPNAPASVPVDSGGAQR